MSKNNKSIIFINYRRVDSGWPAEHLAATIEGVFGKDSVFLDVRSINAGDDFTSEISDKLCRAKVLIVLIGSKWLFMQDKYGKRRLDNKDDWVRREIKEGLQNKSCTLIPVLLDGAKLPSDEEALDKDIAKLLKLQRIEVRQSNSEEDLEALSQIIEEKGFKRRVNQLEDNGISSELAQGIFDAPKLSGIILRTELINKLSSAISNNPIVVVGGLSGCGKTYLMSSYLESKQFNDCYSAVYWYDPSPGETIDSLLTQFSVNLSFSGLSSVALCKELNNFLDESNALLVIDDFHIVDTITYSIMVELANRSGLPCRLILLSQYHVELSSVTESPFHFPITGYTIAETRNILEYRNVNNKLTPWAEELHSKCDGLPFAISLFCSLVIEFNHSPKVLLAGLMTDIKRIKDWYHRIIGAIDREAVKLLPHICLLIGPFNIGEVKCLTSNLNHIELIEAINELQRAYLVTKYSPYRWKIHDLVGNLSSSSLSSEQKQQAHGVIGKYYLRGLSKRSSVILEKNEFLSKVKAFRHLRLCNQEISTAENCLGELSTTAKANGSYRLLLNLSKDAIHDWPKRNNWIDYHHAHCWLILGKPKQCLQVIEPLLYKQEIANNEVLRINLSRLYADALGSLGEENKAIKCLIDIIQTIDIATNINSITLAHVKTSLAWLLMRVQKHSDASSIIDELLSDAHVRGDKRGGAIAMAQKGILSFHSGENNDVEGLLKHAFTLFEECNDRRGQAWCLSNLSEYQLKINKISLAIKYFISAKRIASDIGECGVDYIEIIERLLGSNPVPLFRKELLEEKERINLATM